MQVLLVTGGWQNSRGFIYLDSTEVRILQHWSFAAGENPGVPHPYRGKYPAAAKQLFKISTRPTLNYHNNRYYNTAQCVALLLNKKKANHASASMKKKKKLGSLWSLVWSQAALLPPHRIVAPNCSGTSEVETNEGKGNTVMCINESIPSIARGCRIKRNPIFHLKSIEFIVSPSVSWCLVLPPGMG